MPTSVNTGFHVETTALTFHTEEIDSSSLVSSITNSGTIEEDKSRLPLWEIMFLASNK